MNDIMHLTRDGHEMLCEWMIEDTADHYLEGDYSWSEFRDACFLTDHVPCTKCMDEMDVD